MVFNRYCVPNSPSIPTYPTQYPTWTPVSWTPLVDIPGMPTGEAPLGGYIVALYNFLLGAVGIIAMMMLVYGGFRYMTSAGNPAAMGDAKDIVYSAIIGLSLALISYLIISAINPELLFTAEPTLSPVGGPGYSTNIPPASCAYKSHEGNEESISTNRCRCIGDVDGEGGDTTCEFNKSDYEDYYKDLCDEVVLNCGSPIIATDNGCKCGTITVGLGDVGKYCCAGTSTLYPPDPPPFLNANETCLAACEGHDIDLSTCSGICESIFCATKPKCCIKVDLRVGTSSTDVTYKNVEIDAGGFVFFDALSHSYSCKYPITAVAIDAKSNWWAPFQKVSEYEETIGDYPCRCGIGTKGECDLEDEWCNAKPGRFVYKDFGGAGTYYPKLRMCVGADEGGHVCVDVEDGGKADDEAVTIIVR